MIIKKGVYETFQLPSFSFEYMLISFVWKESQSEEE